MVTLEDWVMDRTEDAIRFFKANDDLLRTTLLEEAPAPPEQGGGTPGQ
jgi:hypothetical protein